MISIDKLSKIFIKTPAIKLVYLIGSAVQNNQRADSDLDIVLVIDKKDIDKVHYGEIYLQLNKVFNSVNLDLRFITPNESDSLFLFQVAGGKLLYAKNEIARVDFEAKTMLRYFDDQHLRNILHGYLSSRIEGGSFGK